MRYAPATPLVELTEKQWQQQVVDLAKQLGWRRPYHTHDSRRSEPGFPDLTLVRDRVIFLELKREKGRLTEPQKDWLRALDAAGAEVYVARPRDLEDLARVLTTRRHGDMWTLPDVGHSRANLRHLTLEEAAA